MKQSNVNIKNLTTNKGRLNCVSNFTPLQSRLSSGFIYLVYPFPFWYYPVFLHEYPVQTVIVYLVHFSSHAEGSQSISICIYCSFPKLYLFFIRLILFTGLKYFISSILVISVFCF